MKNFVKLLGITALVTVIGFAMIACEEEAEGDIGPYVGTWIGTLIKGATEYDDAKLVFTETTWTLESTKAGIDDNGTYTVNSLRRAILKDSDGYTEFTASVLMSALSLNSDIEGSYSGFSGNFTKEGSNNFSGKWNGSITLGEETYDAVIEFATTTWTLTSAQASIDIEGTYDVSIFGTATLKVASVTYGTANVYGSTLIITGASTGDFANGSGTFTKDGVTPPSTNPFLGTWSGTVTRSGQTDAATLTFTEEETWTLFSAGANIDKSGAYERNGYNVTLKDGTRTYGTAYIVINNLTLSGASSGPFSSGKGAFTKD